MTELQDWQCVCVCGGEGEPVLFHIPSILFYYTTTAGILILPLIHFSFGFMLGFISRYFHILNPENQFQRYFPGRKKCTSF